MKTVDSLRTSFRTVDVNSLFTEATVFLCDGSKLVFCHKVGERWARAMVPPGMAESEALATTLLSEIAQFRLNAKHLDVHFKDESRWETRFG
jgi:hypothetical protein